MAIGTGTGPEDAGRRPGRWRSYLLAGGTYLALSLILWWHVLPHPRHGHHLRMR